jgi:hypothetical protein
MNIEQAKEITGGLSTPSKMPCYSFSISAKKCITGGKLREVDGSTCSKCYAFRGNYQYEVVQNAHARRFKGLSHPEWVNAMAFLVNAFESSGYFRWHDSGDLQSVEHLKNIAEVCRLTPDIKHWLPTREYKIVSDFLKVNALPFNLTIRLSAFMIDAEPPKALATRLGVQTSGVSSESAFNCPASNQGNKCVRCRACWDKNVPNVNYKKH